MKYLKKLCIFLVFIILSGFNEVCSQVVVDSYISLSKALEGTLSPKNITDSLSIVDVEYYSDDNKLHRGQIVINTALKNDVIEIFNYIKDEKIPIKMVIPIKFDLPDGNTTMATLNNTYGFHYRKAVGMNKLSNHSFGRAIDINPYNNPFISSKGNVIPKGGEYSPGVNPLSFDKNSKIVKKFIELGWTWGGNWQTPKDYMHFEKK